MIDIQKNNQAIFNQVNELLKQVVIDDSVNPDDNYMFFGVTISKNGKAIISCGGSEGAFTKTLTGVGKQDEVFSNAIKGATQFLVLDENPLLGLQVASLLQVTKTPNDDCDCKICTARREAKKANKNNPNVN